MAQATKGRFASADAAGMSRAPRYHKDESVRRLAWASIKCAPSDFVVDEISPSGVRASNALVRASCDIEIVDGGDETKRQTLCVVRKEDCDGFTARAALERAVRGSVCTAGLKDKRAITYQYATMEGIVRNTIRPRGVRGVVASPLGVAAKPLQIGELAGNHFVIVLRDVHGIPDVPAEMRFPNFFGSQRTGTDDDSGAAWRAGRALLTGDHEAALRVALPRLDKETPKRLARKLRKSSPLIAAVRHLARTRDDATTAIDAIGHRLKTLWLHAYQARLFNVALSALLSGGEPLPEYLPLIGSDTELWPKDSHCCHHAAVARALREDGVDITDFARLRCKGSIRPTLVTATNITIDQGRSQGRSIRLSFDLPAGAFATAFLREICDNLLTCSPNRPTQDQWDTHQDCPQRSATSPQSC